MLTYKKTIFLILLGSFLASFTQKEDKCTNKNHDKANAIYLQGMDKFMANNLKEARLDFLSSIELDPECNWVFSSYRELVTCELGLNENQQALEHLNIAITKPAPNSVMSEFYCLKGRMAYHSENKIECIKNCTTAISYDITNFEPYYLRGRAKAELEDYIGSLKDLTYIIDRYEKIFYRDEETDDLLKQVAELERDKFNKIIGLAYFFRGFDYHQLKVKNKACDDWSKAGDEGIQEAYKLLANFCK